MGKIDKQVKKGKFQSTGKMLKQKKKEKIKFKKKVPKNVFIAENIKSLQSDYAKIDSKAVKHFSNLPISKETLKGLKEAEYEIPTEIQKETIGLALLGKDILGAAKTGSGKTLAFLVPILEKLYSLNWTRLDGAGALVITPTRELAYQIFETLRQIGKYHEFSAGLVIGGKDLKFEWKRVSNCNILICTPGRLLQHLDENTEFNMDNLKVLVLDEADRCLDMGFSVAINAIVSSLPTPRQTMLFSATQTRSIKDLARLSLESPVLVSVHEHSESSTPDSLTQSYIVAELHDKINILWSFLKGHRRKKTLVFLASCKQTKYYQEIFSRMKPGMSVMGLYGSLHQLRRMAIYDQFCSKETAVLFATDIAARGLDFPNVDWVVQLDCPEDATTYTHRAGRTARYNQAGEALLVLTPSEEEAMTAQLRQHKIPISKIEVNPSRQQTVERKMASLLAADNYLKESAQRAFNSYVKSVFLMKNKNVFSVDSIDLPKFAESLGLVTAPRVRFLDRQKKMKQHQKNLKDSEESVSEENIGEINTSDDVSAFNNDDSDNEEDLFTVKRTNHNIEAEDNLCNVADESKEIAESSSKKTNKVVTKAQIAKKLMKKKIQANNKTTFDESGKVLDDVNKQKLSDVGKKYENVEDVDERLGGGIDIKKAKEVLSSEDKFDKANERARIKEKHREDKRKKKEENRRLGKAARGEVSEDDGSDEDGSEPDLSWLPDPDEIYGPEQTIYDSDKVNNEAEIEVKEDKRKQIVVKKIIPRKKAKYEALKDNDGAFDTGLSLGEDEDLALRLLRS